MRTFRLYDNSRTYMFPNASLAGPDAVKEAYPATEVFPHIIETDPNEQVIFSIENLSAAVQRHGIDPALSGEEAVKAIEELMNRPVAVVPSAEERIAAALEYQNIQSL